MSNATRLPAHVVRALAVKAQCDPRTVERFVTGERVQPMNAERIRGAVRDLGIDVPVAGESVT